MNTILINIVITMLQRLIGSKDLVDQIKLLVTSAFSFVDSDGKKLDGSIKRERVLKSITAIGGTLGAVVAATAPMLISALLEMLVMKYKPEA